MQRCFVQPCGYFEAIACGVGFPHNRTATNYYFLQQLICGFFSHLINEQSGQKSQHREKGTIFQSSMWLLQMVVLSENPKIYNLLSRNTKKLKAMVSCCFEALHHLLLAKINSKIQKLVSWITLVIWLGSQLALQYFVSQPTSHNFVTLHGSGVDYFATSADKVV